MELKEDEPVYQISVAAKLVEMHPQTLRMYERQGLIRPKRTGRNIRLYSRRDIERLLQIQRLTQQMGVNLAGVEVILDLLVKMDQMRREMEEQMERMRSRLLKVTGIRQAEIGE